MGKQKRRKRQNTKGKSASNSALSASPTEDAASSASNTPNNVLLQRIRHADPRTRHAALAAVSTTLLDTACTKIHPKITPPLLQAIRERLMDADLDVSQVAAGCLSNYLIIVSATDSQPEIQSMTAGWTVLLVGRLKQCYEPITKTAAKGDTMTAKEKKVRKQWLYLAVQCLHPLCTLVESNPEAVARLTSDFDATTRQNFHETLFEFLQAGQAWLVDSSNQQRLPGTNQSQLEEECGYYQKIVTLASRTLHSAWDDNAALLVPWQQECQDAFVNGLQLLQSIAQNASSNIPVVAKLHATGCLITARPSAHTVEMTRQIVQVLVPHLQFDWTTSQNLLSTWKTTFEAWEKEQEDDVMERDIIRKQEEKKEKSRDIAKRQKNSGKPEAMQADDDETHPPKDNDDDDDDDEELKDPKESDLETQEALEQARIKWNEYLLPLQLALELLANLTSSKEAGGDDHDDDDMMMDDWGPDQEAKLLEEQRQLAQGSSAEEEAFHKALMESPLPQTLARLFQQVYHLPQMEFPEKSQRDLEDLQNKTVACLGNCWGNIPYWPIQLAWNDLQQAVHAASGLGKEGLVSAMLVALKSQPALRKQWQPEHLTFWLQQLQETSKESLPIRRDTIGMLGVLCSQEPHPKEVNQQVCSALLALLTSTDEVMLQCEVLNALMDIYGGDDDDECYHGTVFEALQVLGHFQRCIPSLKKKLLQQERLLKPENEEERMEVEQWKEIALNASRFVQYKKGQL